ncbi:hypothetical protein K435DRAFT_777465 [Dendrothele bispora CBS 962.96]|uniref:Uncharacterized protein n=1 Tax=Dendrothele bispora (strain CBS 962.96) TaxID=1314807 RepID=A0A4S8M9C9_DENBC|nr:hypothetical protein K435DRAFT_777465 [Dendrothele bispora CBS 962.96]
MQLCRGRKLNNRAVPWLSPAPKLSVKYSTDYSGRLTSLRSRYVISDMDRTICIDPFPAFH